MNLRTQLREFEGVVPHAYADSLGYLTIGCGRLIDKRKGGSLSEDEIDYLLDNDIRAKTREVYEALPWVREMNEPRQAVVLNMAFQMGTAGLLRFVRTLDSMRDQRYHDAASGMMQSLWARQTPERARRLAQQLVSGEWN